ncbi:MAG: radical SAM protein [Thermodesulfobacteriota bacterium]|nr:radical SAM protein [Thermodesulfobacteriota bacterium]
MERIKIPPPISGGLMLSYRCSAECRHCMYACSPKWAGDWITEDLLAKYLPQLAKVIQPSPYGRQYMNLSHGLHFSGGEPFMNFELLLKAVHISEALNIPSTFVETNCFWCKSDDLTQDRLKALRGKGLKGIMISANPFYTEYVPFERTERCIRISQEVFGENVIVYQTDYYLMFKYLGVTGKLSIEDYLAVTQEKSIFDRVELFLMGRAANRLKDLYPSHASDRFLHMACQPGFLRSWHNHFDNYGNFMPGFCGGISLGSWFELDWLLLEGIDLSNRPVLKYLVNEDMRGLFHFAFDMGYRETDKGYVSKCHLCLDIRKYLASIIDFKELQPRQFYEQLKRENTTTHLL